MTAPTLSNRWATLATAAALTLAFLGYLRGIREPAPVELPAAPVVVPVGEVPVAVPYADLPRAALQPNAGWHADLATLKSARPGPFDPVVRTEAMKLAALEDRARNRAFDTAPPTIPHGIEATSPAACLACHGPGLTVGDRVATRMSHPHYGSCTQCHVESARPEFAAHAGEVAGNEFQGVGRAGPGYRIGPGAPPAIPHTTWMRQDCTSCHGLVTRPGLRTTHPWLTNCVQCHAPSAALDQVGFPFEVPR